MAGFRRQVPVLQGADFAAIFCDRTSDSLTFCRDIFSCTFERTCVPGLHHLRRGGWFIYLMTLILLSALLAASAIDLGIMDYSVVDMLVCYGGRFDWFGGRPACNQSGENSRLRSFTGCIGGYRLACGWGDNRDRHITVAFGNRLY